MDKIGFLFKEFEEKLKKRKKHIKKEYQAYGLMLADEMGEWEKRSMYIKLAKNLPRKTLEKARYFVKDQSGIKTKGKLFMWKLKQLKNEKSEKKHDKK